jgi:bifunctional non-homologous end joining protein LigD
VIASRLAAELGAPARDVDAKRLSPMLCDKDESRGRILERDGYLFELKLDGVRIVADKRARRVALAYRKLRDATASYPEIAAELATLADERVVLDGEIVAFDARGRPDFQLLAQRIQAPAHGARVGEGRAPRPHPVSVVYVVFDVLAIADRDLQPLPIEARKAILERVIPEDVEKRGLVRVHPTFADGPAVMRFCREHGLEGVVAKRAGSPYRAGVRTSEWVKIKEDREADFVVVGWTEGEGRRSSLGSLDVASYEGGRLLVRGAVGSGLDEGTIDALLARFATMLERGPVAEGRYAARPGKRRHVRPEIVVSVRYQSFTSDGSLRFPVFRGVRVDVDPKDCTTSPDRS